MSATATANDGVSEKAMTTTVEAETHGGTRGGTHGGTTHLVVCCHG